MSAVVAEAAPAAQAAPEAAAEAQKGPEAQPAVPEVEKAPEAQKVPEAQPAPAAPAEAAPAGPAEAAPAAPADAAPVAAPAAQQAPVEEVGVVGGMLAGLRQQVSNLSDGVQARVEQARAGNRMLDEGGPEVEAKLLAKKTHTDALELHEQIVFKLEEAAKMYADAAEKLRASAPTAGDESASFASLSTADAERAQAITKALEVLNDLPEETTISDVEQDAITLLIAKGHYRFAVSKTGEQLNAVATGAGDHLNTLKEKAIEKAPLLSPRA